MEKPVALADIVQSVPRSTTICRMMVEFFFNVKQPIKSENITASVSNLFKNVCIKMARAHKLK